MRIALVAGSLVAFAALAFGAVTLVALEGSTVAVIRTKSRDGSERRTHVWVARDRDGAVWVESATASRPFYLDLAADPAVTIEIRRSALDHRPEILHGRAELVAEPGGHDRIRAMLSSSYGWADAWVALLTDTSGSRAVRIAPDNPD